eukprot:CAMPEP_0168351958 /NCGR_PEP_ID=MMETSP0213-20121227/22233_1 /TAXON_ID=151035 /ORGANISM="Euplotes harpa, Strain FSP1.4" /LENGTH=41 /DNA_ID= /DNA_START= /DNA_END= /DNA_ORIENTATION=
MTSSCARGVKANNVTFGSKKPELGEEVLGSRSRELLKFTGG